MSHRTRATKTTTLSPISPSKSKKKSGPIRKLTTTIQKKAQLDQTSSTIIQPRQKRLSSLTAATLLQYCSSILSPGRKLKTPKEEKTARVSPIKKPEVHIPIRTRREASSRASAMIMQQNEIERSRFNYSSSNLKRHRSKPVVSDKVLTAPEPFQFAVPSSPNVVTIKSIPLDNSKYTILTEASLAEHTRLQESITTKQNTLLKWTEDLASYGRFSPPPDSEVEIPITKEMTGKICISIQ